ncbi:MAG TPA: PRC-barrel domain-containing protein [Anaerolineae bacterium]|nr:PRC-barrel domain-containing protein [Anaerolineae bacterium]
MEIPLNVEVHCTDGRCGRSTHIILNPATEQITHIVVREKQQSRIERLVPVVLLRQTAAEVILLDCTLEEFSTLAPFHQTEFVYGDLPHHATDPSLTLLWPYVVPAKRIVDKSIRSIPPGELVIRRGARVRATDGRVGRVDEFLVDPETGNITHLCLRKDHIWGDKVVYIPVSEIGEIEEKVVRLKADKESIASLPTFPVKRWWQ